jgi:tetratricopeptide (TPR) repeat protein
MARWSGEMEFEFIEGKDSFVATDKVVTFLRTHLARGEVQAAARLYEDAGAACAPDLLREAMTASSSTQKAMAEMFLVARDFKNAAVVFEVARQLDRAGPLFEQALDFDNAARVHEKNGDPIRAATCHERAGRVDRAIELYRSAGPSPALADALARQGHYYDAAAIYKHIFNLKAEIEMLRMVPTTSANRVPAVLRLAELLEQYNHPDQAVGLLVETVRTVEAARYHLPMYSQLARLLEAMGRAAEAAQVRARMQNLLPAASGHSGAGTSGPPATTLPAAPPASPSATTPALVLPPRAPAAPAAVGPAVVGPAGPAGVGPAGAGGPRDPFASLVDPFTAQHGTSPAVDAYTFLKNIPIFAELRAEDMRDLYRASEEVTFGPGQTMIGEGVPGPGLFVVVQGDVVVSRGATTLAQLGPGACVGELSLLDASPTSARVAAGSAVFALFISPQRFHQFIQNHDDAARRIFFLFARTLAERLRAANSRTA